MTGTLSGMYSVPFNLEGGGRGEREREGEREGEGGGRERGGGRGGERERGGGGGRGQGKNWRTQVSNKISKQVQSNILMLAIRLSAREMVRHLG